MVIENFCIISFASEEPYLSEATVLSDLCQLHDIKFKLYNLNWLKSQKIYKNNKKLFDSKKCGYCAWKPYIILDALETFEKVLYLDSSMLFNINVLEQYINSSDYILSTETELKNIYHCKINTFKIMNCEDENFYQANQVWGGTILASRKAKSFLKEWGKYCLIKDCISDENIELSVNLKYHLYDQSIYSLLYKKYNLPRISNACYDDNGVCTAYFCDRREYSHREYIIKNFGNQMMEKQDTLILYFVDKYITNGSCIYNPTPYLNYV